MEMRTFSLRQIAEALRSGRMTAVSIVMEAIERRQQVSSKVDAYAHWAPDTARTMAHQADDAFSRGQDCGRLQGIPVSIKDLFSASGMPTHAGSPHLVPPRLDGEGPIVSRLRNQRSVFMGKTHTSEVGFGVCGENVHWGTPRNPWDAVDVRPAGGSSSGAAISIAEGSALVALGSDTGGIVGMKVTHGRWSGEGLLPPGPSLHGPGILMRSVADAAFAFGAIDEGCDPHRLDKACSDADLSTLRIGLLDDSFWAECEPGIEETARNAVEELAAQGARLSPCSLPEVQELRQVSPDWDWGVSAVELLEFLQSELPGWIETLHPGARRQLESQQDLSATEYLRRLRLLRRLRTAADARLADFDVVVCPSSPISPPRLEQLSEPETYKKINRLAVRNMSFANLLDLCALTMPVGLDAAGLPVGLHVIARRHADETLLAAASAFEVALGTGAQRLGIPPLLRPTAD